MDVLLTVGTASAGPFGLWGQAVRKGTATTGTSTPPSLSIRRPLGPHHRLDRGDLGGLVVVLGQLQVVPVLPGRLKLDAPLGIRGIDPVDSKGVRLGIDD